MVGAWPSGKWTVQQAAELLTAAPTIAAALDARYLSAAKAERVKASEVSMRIYGDGGMRHVTSQPPMVRSAYAASAHGRVMCQHVRIKQRSVSCDSFLSAQFLSGCQSDPQPCILHTTACCCLLFLCRSACMLPLLCCVSCCSTSPPVHARQASVLLPHTCHWIRCKPHPF